MSYRYRRLLGLALAVLVLLLDQVSKAAVLQSEELGSGGAISLIPTVLNCVFTWNTGATFGLFRYDHAWIVLIPMTIATIAALLFGLARSSRVAICCAMGGILGGAIGNVLDRIRYGKVVDFLHLHLGAADPFPYIFNLGDSAIVIGVCVLFMDQAFFGSRRASASRQSNGSPT